MTVFHTTNCRYDGEADGKVRVFLPRRREPLLIPKSWVKFSKRNVPPKYRNRKINFPLVLKMPVDLAIQCGVTKCDNSPTT